MAPGENEFDTPAVEGLSHLGDFMFSQKTLHERDA